LLADLSIDSNRIYATGMSNGGFMSYRLACELSERIAAIAPVAASMSMQECIPSRQVPMIHFHSYLDEAVPYEGGIGAGLSSHHNAPIDSVLNYWSNFNECLIGNDTIMDNNNYTHIAWDDCDCNYKIQQYITQDGGHSWPGGMATPMGDPVSSFINANDLMWSFFENQSLECIYSSTTDYEIKPNIRIHPNPSMEKVFIESDGNSSDFNVIVYNLKGQIVLKADEVVEIDIKGLQIGTYFIKVVLGHKVWVKQIVKID